MQTMDRQGQTTDGQGRTTGRQGQILREPVR